MAGIFFVENDVKFFWHHFFWGGAILRGKCWLPFYHSPHFDPRSQGGGEGGPAWPTEPNPRRAVTDLKKNLLPSSLFTSTPTILRVGCCVLLMLCCVGVGPVPGLEEKVRWAGQQGGGVGSQRGVLMGVRFIQALTMSQTIAKKVFREYRNRSLGWRGGFGWISGRGGGGGSGGYKRLLRPGAPSGTGPFGRWRQKTGWGWGIMIAEWGGGDTAEQ